MKVPSYGPANARIMIVGEAPGADEEKIGRPFVGKAGETLREGLMSVGIDPEECFYANICRYRPPNNMLHTFFADGGIPDARVQEGLLELARDIAAVRPNVIYAAGNFALWALTGKAKWFSKMKDGQRIRGFTGIQDYRGSIMECSLVPGMKVIPSFHPSYIMREGMADQGSWSVDLAKIKEDSTFPELRWPDKEIILARPQPMLLVNYHDVLHGADPVWEPHDESRERIRDRLLSTPSVPTTLDIEYIGSKLLCVGLTNHRDSAVVIPTGNYSDHMYMESIVSETKQFNAQNSMFDAGVLDWHFSIRIMERVTFDTMLVAAAANIELPKALDYLLSVYTRQPYHKGMVNWEAIKAGKQSVDVVYPYNGIDVWGQHEVMEEQIKWELGEDAVRKTYDFLMAMLIPLWDMSKRGVRIDQKMIREMSEQLEQDALMNHFKLMKLVGRTDPINVRSPKQVAELLFEQLGLTPLGMNKTGPKCDDKTLAELSSKATTDQQKTAITAIRTIRTAENLKSKFFDIEFDDDGRMRGSYDPTKTVTGRLASRKFHPTGKGTNAQNIPRDKRARRAFIADRGKVFGYGDLEKAESLVVAHLTGDPRMLFDHSPGQNAHKNLGAALFSKTPDELTEEEYYLSKKTRHAGNYLQGWMTLMRSINQETEKTGIEISSKEAQFFTQGYKDLHPYLQPWWTRTKNQLYANRTLYNLIGRKRVFYGHTSSNLPEAVAFVPQSTVGDTLNIGLLNVEGHPCPYSVENGIFDPLIAEELKDCGYEGLMQIHDAIAFQCFEKDLDRFIPLFRKALVVPLLNPRTYEHFTIPVEIAVDVDPEHLREWKSNWGDSKVYKKDLMVA